MSILPCPWNQQNSWFHTHTHTHTLTNSHPHFSNLWPQTELHPWLSLFFRLSMAYFGISYPPQSHKPILIKKSPLIYLCFLFVLLLWRPLIYKESSQKAGITGRFRWGMKEIQTRQWLSFYYKHRTFKKCVSFSLWRVSVALTPSTPSIISQIVIKRPRDTAPAKCLQLLRTYLYSTPGSPTVF